VATRPAAVVIPMPQPLSQIFHRSPQRSQRPIRFQPPGPLPPLAAQRASAEGRRQAGSTWAKMFRATLHFFSRGSFGYRGFLCVLWCARPSLADLVT
jgi:hypothetical protein